MTKLEPGFCNIKSKLEILMEIKANGDSSNTRVQDNII